jgi:hypothetical protein
MGAEGCCRGGFGGCYCRGQRFWLEGLGFNVLVLHPRYVESPISEVVSMGQRLVTYRDFGGCAAEGLTIMSWR